MASFPTSLDTFTNPGPNDYTDAVPHSSQHSNANDAIEAIEAKVGIGSSTPILGKALIGTGTGESAWGGMEQFEVRASGGDDAATIRAAIADASEGTVILFPDTEYLIGSVSSNVGVTVNKDNIWLVGRGVPEKNTTSPTTYGATRFKFTAGVNTAYEVMRWTADGDPQTGTLTAQLVGGGLSGIIIDGNFQAGTGLRIAASQRQWFRDFAVLDATGTQFEIGYLTHTSGGANGLNVVRNAVFERFSIRSYGTGPGVSILGNQTYGAEAPYFISIRDFTVIHGDKQGLYINGCDDIWFYGYNPISTSSAADAYAIEITTGGNNFTYGLHFFGTTPLQSPKGVVVRASGLGRAPQGITFYGLGTVDRTTAPITVEPGAQVAVIDDTGQSSLRSKLSFATPPIEDDFIGGSTTSTDVGELKWNLTGAGTLTYVPAETGHPGILRLGSSAVPGVYAILRPGGGGANAPVHTDDNFDVSFIFRLGFAGSDTDALVRFGLGNDATANPPTDGIYIEKLAADSSWYAVCRASGTETRTVIGSVGSSFTWFFFRIRRYSDTKIGFSVGAEVNQTPDVTISTNVPSVAAQPFIGVRTAAAAEKYLDMDAFGLQVTGLSRMTT